MSKSVLIAAGGTGGHIFPGLAVAEELSRQGVSLLWLGTPLGLEATLVPRAGYQLLAVDISGVRRKGVWSIVVAPLRIARAVLQSITLLRRWRPGVVLGMGGFVSGPAGLAAWLLRIPLLMHEQNAVAGLTNTVLSRFADRVMEAFPGTFGPRPAICTGNPVRHDICALPAPEMRPRRAEDAGVLRLLIFGGSQGAQVLNEVVPAAVAGFSRGGVEIWHQAGRNRADAPRAAYATAGVRARVEEFIHDMAAAYAWADLVICRSGALTVAELAAAGVGSILVPFPGAVDDHQTVNAHYLSDAGAAVLVTQERFTPETLSPLLNDLLLSRGRLLEMARRARSLARVDATAAVAAQCMEFLRD